MLLAIDTGNTHIVIGVIDLQKCEVCKTVQITTDPIATAYEYAAKMKVIFELASIDPTAFTGAIISSVVPQVNVVLSKAVEIITGLRPLILGAGVKTGLNIRLDDPGTIAGDMVATAVAAKEEYPLPAIIIDMGTATTITVVNKEGTYLGGCIMPGAGISLDALSRETALLPSVDFAPPRKVIGTNTIDAIKGGLIYGQAGALDGVIDRYAEELGGIDQIATIVATGGLGRLVAPYCRHEIIIDNRLLLKGLAHIWNKNLELSRKGRKKRQPN